jgi:predicted TIM-barrel fold metal-dependent hydrolase
MSLTRRQFGFGLAGVVSCAAIGNSRAQGRRIFDAHCHIIDHNFPITPNQGYTPPNYPLEQYLASVKPLGVTGGAIVSGSFHGFDQSYLETQLPKLGKGWVGVTQVPNDIPDAEIARLSGLGVRALRFNMFRGRIDSVDDVVALANRAYAVGRWHAEIYADAAALSPHVDQFAKLPQIVIDHLGMTEQGLPVVLDLVRAGAKIKATGFGRVNIDVPKALERIYDTNSSALMFGTDLPSTRAQRPFEPSDIAIVEKTLGEREARRVFWDNAASLYRVQGA